MLSARLQAIGGARTLTSQDSQHCRLLHLHRYYAAVDGAPGSGGTYPFKYEGQPDNCGILNMSQGGCANNNLDPLGVGLGGGDVDIAEIGRASCRERV